MRRLLTRSLYTTLCTGVALSASAQESQLALRRSISAGPADPMAVAYALGSMEHTNIGGERLMMRAEDHQLFQPIQISVHTDEGIELDGDNSGFGLLTEVSVPLENTMLPASCEMQRP